MCVWAVVVVGLCFALCTGGGGRGVRLGFGGRAAARRDYYRGAAPLLPVWNPNQARGRRSQARASPSWGLGPPRAPAPSSSWLLGRRCRQRTSVRRPVLRTPQAGQPPPSFAQRWWPAAAVAGGWTGPALWAQQRHRAASAAAGMQQQLPRLTMPGGGMPSDECGDGGRPGPPWVTWGGGGRGAQTPVAPYAADAGQWRGQFTRGPPPPGAPFYGAVTSHADATPRRQLQWH